MTRLPLILQYQMNKNLIEKNFTTNGTQPTLNIIDPNELLKLKKKTADDSVCNEKNEKVGFCLLKKIYL